jgi:hypothetical protein
MANLFSRHSLLVQTTFSEVKRQAFEQPFVLIGSPGSVGEREVKGRRFLYRQFYDAQGKKAAEYIGSADDDDARARSEAIRAQIVTAKALVDDVRMLARQGYVRADSRASAVLGAIANRNLFRAGAVLVGSHAYGSLLNELGVKAAGFATEDVDIARGESLEVAGDHDFATILAESTVPLRPVPPFDRRGRATSYKVPGRDRFRVDLLVPARGQEVTTRAVPELGAYAAALPYLAYLLEQPIEAVVLGRESVVPVRVPSPERFAWHKMLVSQMRTSTTEKRGKDIQQAGTLVAVLAADAPQSLEESFAALPRSAKSKVRSGAALVRRNLEVSGEERGVELLGQLASA